MPSPLNIATICKADHWVDDVLPRFAALVDANCTRQWKRLQPFVACERKSSRIVVLRNVDCIYRK